MQGLLNASEVLSCRVSWIHASFLGCRFCIGCWEAEARFSLSPASHSPVKKNILNSILDPCAFDAFFFSLSKVWVLA